MNTKKIGVGCIVKVIAPDLRFTDKRGFVLEIVDDGNEDGPVGVRFPYWYDLFDYGTDKDVAVRFNGSDLEIVECFDTMPREKFLKELFGRMGVNVYYERKIPLIPGQTKCGAKDCKKMAYFEIWINCWGTATSYHVCGKHAD